MKTLNFTSLNITLSEVIEEYCARPNLVISTKLYRKHLYYRYLYQYYKLPIWQFSRAHALKIIKEIDNYVGSRTHKPLSQNTKWSSLKDLTALFNYAVSRGYIPESPFEGMKYSFIKKTVKYMTVEEIQIFISSEFKNEDFKTAVFLALFAGLRRGEIVGLSWDDIDFEKRIITVQRSFAWYAGKGYVMPTKNKRERVVPINDILLQTLINKNNKEGNVVNLSLSHLTNSLPAHFKKIRLPRYTFHDLRRTFATVMLSEGSDLKTVSRLLGHKDINVTCDYYAGIVDSILRRAVGSLDSVINR